MPGQEPICLKCTLLAALLATLVRCITTNVGDVETKETLMGKKFRLAKIMVGLMAVVGSVVATAPAAHAVTCYGDYCSGKDPQLSGCSADGVTVAAVDVSGGRLELRWS